MRRKLPVILGTAILAFVVACEGPAGPQGPAGEAGPQGAKGDPGVSPVVNCQDCHRSDTYLVSRVLQYENSVHATGGNFERASDKVCAVCHSDEGFVERIADGTDTIAAAPANPTPPSCRTCHMIHTNYDSTDLQLRTTSPVTLMLNGETVDLGKGGEANLCAECHQPRLPDPMPTMGDTAHLTLASAYWGPHHGPQGAVLAGTGAFEFSGSQTIAGGPTAHGSDQGGCPQCHMAAAYGVQAGGHTWNMTYTLHGTVDDNTAGCVASGCHSSMADFDKGGVQTDVETMLDSLQTLLNGKGIMSGSGLVAGTYSSDLIEAYYNWAYFDADRSMGVHNPDYVQAVLQNTIEKVNVMP